LLSAIPVQQLLWNRLALMVRIYDERHCSGSRSNRDNFAAGMSGGIAYVLDETGAFSSTLCNRSMVDIDTLDAKDEETVRTLVERHFEYTASPRARFILDPMAQLIKKFVKVFPHDY